MFKDILKNKQKLSLAIIAVSFLFILLSEIVQNIPCAYPWLVVSCKIISAVCTSLLAGAFITTALDIPDLIENFKTLLLDFFTKDEFIDSIEDDKKLRALKDKVLKRLHRKSFRSDEFVRLESYFDDLVSHPYYEYFIETVVAGPSRSYDDCVREITKTDNEKEGSSTPSVKGEFYIRHSSIEFELVNPKIDDDTLADIAVKKSIDLFDGDIKEMFVLNDFEVSIDGSEFYSVVPFVSYHIGRKGSNPQTMTYNTSMSLSLHQPENKDYHLDADMLPKLKSAEMSYVENRESSYSQLFVKFRNKVTVKMDYKQILPVSDAHYTRRMRYAAKTYCMNFLCDDNYNIHGQILGTLLDQRAITTNQPEGRNNSIMINCRSWLLAGNGVFIVLDDICKNVCR